LHIQRPDDVTPAVLTLDDVIEVLARDDVIDVVGIDDAPVEDSAVEVANCEIFEIVRFLKLSHKSNINQALPSSTSCWLG